MEPSEPDAPTTADGSDTSAAGVLPPVVEVPPFVRLRDDLRDRLIQEGAGPIMADAVATMYVRLETEFPPTMGMLRETLGRLNGFFGGDGGGKLKIGDVMKMLSGKS